jgi:hypothetical protein
VCSSLDCVADKTAYMHLSKQLSCAKCSSSRCHRIQTRFYPAEQTPAGSCSGVLVGCRCRADNITTRERPYCAMALAIWPVVVRYSVQVVNARILPECLPFEKELDISKDSETKYM